MSEHTPDTDEARTFYELGVLDRTTRDPDGEFDRWLQHVRAAAWEEGYLLATGGMMHDPNPYEATNG